MNKLLDESPLLVLPSLACEIGLNESIILQQLHYWLQKSKKVINNYKWVYNSMPQWCDQFPFWSEKTIKRTMQSLRESGIVVAEHLSDNTRDRSLFYRIDYDKLSKCKRTKWPDPLGQNDPMDEDKMTRCIYSQRLQTETTTETTKKIQKKGASTPTNNEPKPLESAKAASVIQSQDGSTVVSKKTKQAIEKPVDVEEQTWSDFLELRKAKRSPLTQTALNAIRKEAGKAGLSLDSAISECCARGWVGFKSDWLSSSSKNGSAQKEEKFSVSDYIFGQGKYSEKREVKDIFDIEVLDSGGVI